MAMTNPVTFPVATMSRPVERSGKLHLLVVDEDAAIRSACCEIATDLGFVPQTVSSVEAARTLLRVGSADQAGEYRSPDHGAGDVPLQHWKQSGEQNQGRWQFRNMRNESRHPRQPRADEACRCAPR